MSFLGISDRDSFCSEACKGAQMAAFSFCGNKIFFINFVGISIFYELLQDV